MGLTELPHSPCLLLGTLIPNQPPIYIGLYVDNFVYYSNNDCVEKVFDHILPQSVKIDFMGPWKYFLGQNFHWEWHDKDLHMYMAQLEFLQTIVDKTNLLSST